jgi:hypothetical protein
MAVPGEAAILARPPVTGNAKSRADERKFANDQRNPLPAEAEDAP